MPRRGFLKVTEVELITLLDGFLKRLDDLERKVEPNGGRPCARAPESPLPGLPATPRSKLDPLMVRIIRLVPRSLVRDSEFARAFGVERNAIARARNGATWRNVDVPPRVQGT